MTKLRPSLISMALMSAGFMSSVFSAEQDALLQMPTVEVVGATPLGGVAVPLSQFPANAQTLTAKDANEQGVTNLADLLNNNLGPVSVSNGVGNGYQNDVNYRGFQASSLLGAPVGLSVYFDGIRMNEPFGSVVNWDLIPMNAMSRVSVLPGSNPMFGLNTLGGALVIDTKNGKDSPGASVGVLAGSFGRQRVNFENGWVDRTHDTDYFFAGNVDQQNGFRDHSGANVTQLFGKARWRGNGGNTRFELSGALADTSLRGTQALPMDMMGNTRSAYTWPDSTENRMALIQLKGTHALDDNQQLSGNVYFRKGHAHNINSNVNLDDGCFNSDGSFVMSGTTPKCANKAPNGTAVNSVTNANALSYGYGRWTSSINSSLVDSMTRQETVGTSLQWANFNNLLGSKNAFTLGASVDRSKINYAQSTSMAKLVNYQVVTTPNQNYGFTANGLPPSATNLPTFNGSNLLGAVNLDATTTNLSAYFTDTLALSEKLSITASGSFNQTTINQTGANQQYLNDDGGTSWTSLDGTAYYNPAYMGAYKSASSGSGVSAVTAPVGGIAGPQTNSLNGDHQYRRFNPAIGFNYNLDSEHGIFGGYSEAMRAPTSIELSCADPNSPCALPTGFNGDPDLKAVVAKTIEFGGRGKWGSQTFWNAAVFTSRLSNDIQFIASSAALGYFANVGNTERRGFELGTHTKMDQWALAAHYGYVEATYKSAFTTASGQDVTSGNKIPGIASQTLKLRPSYAVSPDLLLGANLIVVGSQYAHGNESNTDPNGKVAGYSLLNLDAHYSLSKTLRVSGNINNVLNKQYATYGLAGMTSVYTLATQQFNTPAPQRGVWVGLSYKFGG
jgi:outer membrane receptor protein involved in Fe transport